jgi:hypothetical protein
MKDEGKMVCLQTLLRTTQLQRLPAIINFMTEPIRVGDRVRIFLNSRFWDSEGWFEGVVVRIEPYSAHRSFYWVELSAEAQAILGGGVKLISVLNPKKIERVEP